MHSALFYVTLAVLGRISCKRMSVRKSLPFRQGRISAVYMTKPTHANEGCGNLNGSALALIIPVSHSDPDALYHADVSWIKQRVSYSLRKCLPRAERSADVNTPVRIQSRQGLVAFNGGKVLISLILQYTAR